MPKNIILRKILVIMIWMQYLHYWNVCYSRTPSIIPLLSQSHYTHVSIREDVRDYNFFHVSFLSHIKQYLYGRNWSSTVNWVTVDRKDFSLMCMGCAVAIDITATALIYTHECIKRIMFALNNSNRMCYIIIINEKFVAQSCQTMWQLTTPIWSPIYVLLIFKYEVSIDDCSGLMR